MKKILFVISILIGLLFFGNAQAWDCSRGCPSKFSSGKWECEIACAGYNAQKSIERKVSTPFEVYTASVYIACAIDNGYSGQGNIRPAIDLLVQKGFYNREDFNNVNFFWCTPLKAGAGGMVPKADVILLSRPYRFESDLELAVLIGHEMVHIKQIRDLGMDRFATQYSGEILSGKGTGCDSRNSSNGNFLECSAYNTQDRIRNAMNEEQNIRTSRHQLPTKGALPLIDDSSPSGTSLADNNSCPATFSPAPFQGRTGKIAFYNEWNSPVTVVLYHPNSRSIYDRYTVQPKQNSVLGSNIIIGDDWGVCFENKPGSSMTVNNVGAITDYNPNYFPGVASLFMVQNPRIR